MSEPEQTGEKPLRLTQDVREALLRRNEGFTDSSYFSGKNFSESRQYEIIDGKLHVHSNSKTSWADSRRENDFVADSDATHRFLSKNLPFLDTDGVAEDAAAARAVRKAAEKADREAAAQQAPAPAPVEETQAVDQVVAHTSKRAHTGVMSNRNIAAVVTVVIAAVWVAPHAKRAWETKGKPRVDEWRARRAAARAEPVEQSGETEAEDPR